MEEEEERSISGRLALSWLCLTRHVKSSLIFARCLYPLHNLGFNGYFKKYAPSSTQSNVLTFCPVLFMRFLIAVRLVHYFMVDICFISYLSCLLCFKNFFVSCLGVGLRSHQRRESTAPLGHLLIERQGPLALLYPPLFLPLQKQSPYQQGYSKDSSWTLNKNIP